MNKKIGAGKFSTVLLDVDGTLLDFVRSEREGISAVLRNFGVEPTDKRIQMYHDLNESFWASFERGEITKEELVWRRFQVYFAQLGRQVNGRKAEEQYRSQLDCSAFLMEGAAELRAYLKERYDLYVVTNGTSATQYKRLALSGLDLFMDGIFVSEDAGSQKPRKEYFDYCFSRMREKDPNKMILVGDSPASDLKGAMNAGISSCWYNPDGKTLPEGIRADYEVRSLEELCRLL